MYTSFFSFLKAKLVVLLVSLMGSVILSSCNHDDSTLVPEKIENKKPLKFKVNFLGSIISYPNGQRNTIVMQS